MARQGLALQPNSYPGCFSAGPGLDQPLRLPWGLPSSLCLPTCHAEPLCTDMAPTQHTTPEWAPVSTCSLGPGANLGSHPGLGTQVWTWGSLRENGDTPLTPAVGPAGLRAPRPAFETQHLVLSCSVLSFPTWE